MAGGALLVGVVSSGSCDVPRMEHAAELGSGPVVCRRSGRAPASGSSPGEAAGRSSSSAGAQAAPDVRWRVHGDLVRADAVGTAAVQKVPEGCARRDLRHRSIFSTSSVVAGGPIGAVAMTIGVFLPAFSFSLVLGHRLETIVQHAALLHALEGVAAGVVGIIAVTALDLGIGVARDAPSRDAAVAVFAGALLLLLALRSRAAVPIVIALGAVAGVVLFGGG